MVAGKGPGNGRSRSPIRDAGQAGPLPKGSPVLFFHKADPAKKGDALVRIYAEKAPWLLQSHGWFPGVLQSAYDPANVDAADESTWPLVQPKKEVVFVDKTGKKVDKAASNARRCLLIRDASAQPRQPVLSLVLVRWGGTYSAWMDEEEANDGDWGKYGSPPSDEYMSLLVEHGVSTHPKLVSKGCVGPVPDYEVYHLFVGSSKQVASIRGSASWLASTLKGKRKSCFWMLWPAEWEDSGDPDFACYVERQMLFSAMRACEAAGIRSGFPHPADLLETITSKTWMATLCLNQGARLPAAAMVPRELVVTDPAAAAKNALAALEHIRCINPFPCGDGEPPAPSAVNKDGVKQGMVKCGWSWENRFVLKFSNVQQLQARMTELFELPACTASTCIVQEWCDFDFEARFYFLLSEEWQPGTKLEPTRIECNIWSTRDDKAKAGTPAGSFSKLTHDQAVKHWQNDSEAWEDAKTKAIDVSQFLISWLRVNCAKPVPMIRLDFMLRRLGPGKARVIFGEYCEVGACCLGWKEGPPAIWRVVLDSVLR